MRTATDYRPEIDGLRALAVLAVMAFHAGFGWAQGGWMGVDIFFVISGYLITQVILRQRREGRFSLRHFWMRRVRRILPALLLTLLASAPFAIAWLLPAQLQDYGQSLVASALMGNNVLLYLTGGYWAEPVQFKPLMHTWTLGVEEQFYLVVPPLMLLALRTGERWLRLMLALLAAGGFALAMVWAEADGSGAFLLLPARLWELALGGAVALARPAPQRGWLAWAGLALMLASLGLFGLGPYPVPVLVAPAATGCALFLHGANARRGAGWLMARRPLVAVGLVSYSAYLFHQPVFAFLRLMRWEPPQPWQLGLAIPAILLAAWASWRWVETPARDLSRIDDRAILLASGGGIALAVALGLAMHVTSGFERRWPELAGAGDNSAYVNSAFHFEGRRLDPATRAANVLFIGNSMARDAINMALEGGGIDPQHISYLEMQDCSDAGMAQSLARARNAGTVIIASTIGFGRSPCYARWLDRLAAAGVAHPLVLAPKQFGWSLNPAMRLDPAERLALRVALLPAYRGVVAQAHAAIPAGRFLDPLASVADPQGRVPLFTPQGLLVTQDRYHLTPAGARWLGAKLFAQPQLRHLRDQS